MHSFDKTSRTRFQAFEDSGLLRTSSPILYEDVSAFEFNKDSAAMATSVSAWARLLTSWGVTPNRSMVELALRPFAATQPQALTAKVVQNWPELAEVLRSADRQCRFLGHGQILFPPCEPRLSCAGCTGHHDRDSV